MLRSLGFLHRPDHLLLAWRTFLFRDFRLFLAKYLAEKTFLLRELLNLDFQLLDFHFVLRPFCGRSLLPLGERLLSCVELIPVEYLLKIVPVLVEN